MKKLFAFTLLAAMLLLMSCAVPVLAESGETGGAAHVSVDLTPFLQALIGLLATLVTARLVPWIKSKTTAEQQQKLDAAVRVAVYAAEEVYRSGHGDEKLQYAQSYLARNGYAVDVETIKAQVNQMRDEKALTDISAVEPDDDVDEDDESIF